MNSFYAKYISLLFSQFPVRKNKCQIKPNKVKLLKVAICKLPKVNLYDEHKEDTVLNLFEGQQKLYLQVFKDDTLLYNSMEK